MFNSNMTENRTLQLYEVVAGAATISASARPEARIKPWCIEALVIVVGLLALFLLLFSVGGYICCPARLPPPWCSILRAERRRV